MTDAPDIESAPPRAVRQYTFVERLGTGGMGDVFLAQDTRLKRRVAIKVLREDIHGPKPYQSLLSEARIAATLEHPNICSVFEVIEEAASSYIVMPFVEGETLRERMERKRLTFAEATEIGLQIADGLAEAHRQGIVHRDIKPANIMITERGLVKILDFGIAKSVTLEPEGEASEVLTTMGVTGAVVGTIPYMSPEQLCGEPVDARSDVFSLCTMLFEMVAGQHPFKTPAPTTTAAAILVKEPPGLRSLEPSSPGAFERVLQKGLEKNPDARYADAAELGRDLRTLAATGHVSVHPGRHASVARRRFIGAGIAAVALAVVVVAALNLRGRITGTVNSGPLDTIAVLPLSNLTGDPTLEYLSDGLTESLINDLSALPDVRVTSRFSAFSYKDRSVDPRAVGEELAVKAIVTGRLRTAPGGYELSVEITEANNNEQVWGMRYAPQADELPVMQRRIARDLSRNLRLELSAAGEAALSGAYTSNPEAHRLLLRANYHYYRFTEGDLVRALDFYEDATKADPGYALAFANMARAYSTLAGNFWAVDRVAADWRRSALKALELDEELADAHYALALNQYRAEWDWASAEASFLQALRLNPNLADARTAYGGLLYTSGRFGEAEEQLQEAIGLDPISMYHNITLAQNYFYGRNFESSVRQYDATLELEPRHPTLRYSKAKTLSHLGRNDEAYFEIEEVLQIAPDDPSTVAAAAYVYARGGRREEALVLLDRVESMLPLTEVNLMSLVQVHGALGDVDRGMELLERAYEERHPWMIVLAVDPKLDPLRSSPRFERLLAALNLPTVLVQ